MKIPLIEWFIRDEDESGVDCVALVDEPAIMLNYQVFSKEGKTRFSVDKSKGIIAGPVMIPNLPIVRNDEQYGTYRGFFSKDTVFKIRNKYMKKKFTSNVNLMHEAGLTVDDVYVVDCFIIDKEMGYVTPSTYGHELPDGTWWMGFKVDNPDVIDVVKDQLVKGFSVEGRFIDKYIGNAEESLMDEIEKIILG